MATTYGDGYCSLVFSLAMDTYEEVEDLSGDEASDLGRSSASRLKTRTGSPLCKAPGHWRRSETHLLTFATSALAWKSERNCASPELKHTRNPDSLLRRSLEHVKLPSQHRASLHTKAGQCARGTPHCLCRKPCSPTKQSVFQAQHHPHIRFDHLDAGCFP